MTAADSDEITEAESELLEHESTAARALDIELATGLGRAQPRGATSSRSYLREVGVRPLPRADLERRLIAAAKRGDRRAREELIEACLPLIAGVARVYRGAPSITRVELMQEGVVGVLRALERFDPSRGRPFWAYASWWVRQAMQQLVAELTRPIVLSDRALRQLSQIKGAHRELLQRHGQEPTSVELSRATGLSEGQIGDLLAVERPTQSLDEPVAATAGALSRFGELLDDPLASDAYERLLDESELAQVRALMASLSDRERAVLRSRYGLGGPEESLRDVAERLGLSAERVRQIEQRALGKLRAAAGG